MLIVADVAVKTTEEALQHYRLFTEEQCVLACLMHIFLMQC